MLGLNNFCIKQIFKINDSHCQLEFNFKAATKFAIKFHLINFVVVLIFGKTNFESSKLQCDYCYRGHLNKTRQSDCRTRTMKFNQSRLNQ